MIFCVIIAGWGLVGMTGVELFFVFFSVEDSETSMLAIWKFISKTVNRTIGKLVFKIIR